MAIVIMKISAALWAHVAPEGLCYKSKFTFSLHYDTVAELEIVARQTTVNTLD